jgi:methyltransferase (TIGR00027 family)
MRPEGASRTADEAAWHRAAHQLLEKGQLLCDPLAVRILGETPEAIAKAAREQPEQSDLRIFIAARTRFAEDTLAAAVRGGARQLVVLGAGLDTFAYRNVHRDLRVFEVDHPATQAWKRERLARASIEEPASLTFVAIDFEQQSLCDGLSAAGFDASIPAFFTWLGVVVYLSEAAAWSTLRFIAGMLANSHVVFDYSNPLKSVSATLRAGNTVHAKRMAKMGEPWINFFDTEELHRKLRAIGFTELDDLGPTQIVARYLPGRALPENDVGPHLLHAAKRRK